LILKDLPSIEINHDQPYQAKKKKIKKKKLKKKKKKKKKKKIKKKKLNKIKNGKTVTIYLYECNVKISPLIS